jgi:glutamyl-tRNA reductase
MPQRKPQLFCLGASHKTAAIEFREELYLNDEQLLFALPPTLQKFRFRELAALSTCNRFEMFGVLDPSLERNEEIISAYVEMQRLAEKKLPVDIDKIRASTYLLHGSDAIRHIFSVAASLDSLIVGETQITGQFKNALAIAKEATTLGSTLDRLGQEALSAAKKVRNQTSISERTVSISHAALDIAKRVFRNLAERKILIIGAGEMGQVAAQYAANYHPVELFIANRTIPHAQTLVQKLGVGRAYGLDSLPDLIREADIVISATGSPGLVLELEMVERAVKQRRGRPLFMVDIALPRDIAPGIGELSETYLFDIDDLKQVVDDNKEQRQLAAKDAEVIIQDVTNQFVQWLDTHSVKPALAEFREYLNNLIEQESAKTLSKEVFSNLSDKQRALLTGLMESLATKVSGDASRNINSALAGQTREQLAAALKSLFSIGGNSNRR